MAHEKIELISTHVPSSRKRGLMDHEAIPLVQSALEEYARTRPRALEIARALVRSAGGDWVATGELVRLARNDLELGQAWLFEIKLDEEGASISFDDGRMGISVCRPFRSDTVSVTVEFGPYGSRERAYSICERWGERAVYVMELSTPSLPRFSS